MVYEARIIPNESPHVGDVADPTLDNMYDALETVKVPKIHMLE